MAQKSVILVTGLTGQIGSELVPALRKIYGNENVIAGYNKTPPTKVLQEGPCEKLDVQYKDAIVAIVKKYNVDVIYHLASLLSATSESLPDLAWDLNLVSLKHVLEIAKDLKIKKVFWPSSIGAFGPTTPRDNTPQRTVLEPTSLYGVTKVAGELLCNYYYTRHGVDVRSLRYPGIISIETMPGGGTTDYSVAIFYDAIQKGAYTCYLKPQTYLPMMYMPDAIHAAINLMDAPSDKLTVRTSYNLTAFSFTPEMITKELQKHVTGLKVDYAIDPVRQSIADSWPDSIDDSQAQLDWQWKPQFDFEAMVKDCYQKLHDRLKSTSN